MASTDRGGTCASCGVAGYLSVQGSGIDARTREPIVWCRRCGARQAPVELEPLKESAGRPLNGFRVTRGWTPGPRP